MSQRVPSNVPEHDLPWNDEPAGTDVVPGTEKPDPAEVEGDEGEEVDVSHGASPDPYLEYQAETLERLAEEVPDRTLRAQAPEAGEFQSPDESGDDDLLLDRGEPDDIEGADGDEPAEDAAIHITRHPVTAAARPTSVRVGSAP